MGYESKFDYEFSSDVEINDITELNKKIAKLDGGMGESIIGKSKFNSITYYYIELDYSYGKFYNNKDFAELLSQHIVKGSVNLTWIGEDGTVESMNVYPNKTENLKCVFVPESIADKVQKYISKLTKN